MKKLTRVKLINWHRFTDVVVISVTSASVTAANDGSTYLSSLAHLTAINSEVLLEYFDGNVILWMR